jgi:hypothetical protein
MSPCRALNIINSWTLWSPLDGYVSTGLGVPKTSRIFQKKIDDLHSFHLENAFRLCYSVATLSSWQKLADDSLRIVWENHSRIKR